METIICPTNFLTSSENAIRYADQLAHWMQARIILFHNLYEPASPAIQSYGGILYAEPIRNPEFKQAQLTRLGAWKDKLTRAKGTQPVTYESQIRYGLPEHTIPVAALENGADLVVLGTKRTSGLKGIFSGSVVSKVIRYSPSPVLVIPPQVTFKPLTKIVFATNLMEIDAPDIGFLSKLTAVFQAQLLVFHLMTENSPVVRQEAEIIFDQFRQKLPDINTTFHIETHENLEDGILQFTHQVKADLLIMGCHHHSAWERILLGNPTKTMLSRTPLPVLIIHY